jgi:hypothetical protein
VDGATHGKDHTEQGGFLVMSSNEGGLAFVSDIAVHHAEVFYGHGTPTLAALCDLAEICQAAVLNEQLLVSPSARRHSTLLQQLEFVPDMTPVVVPCDDDSELAAAPQAGDDRREIVIDVDAEGELTSTGTEGLAVLAVVAAELLQDAPVLGRAINPRVLADVENRGLFMLDQLPIFMLLLQASAGELGFESDEAREVLYEQVGPDLAAYRAYASRILRMREEFGVDTVFSCLEDPLAAEARLPEAAQARDEAAGEPDRCARSDRKSRRSRLSRRHEHRPEAPEGLRRVRLGAAGQPTGPRHPPHRMGVQPPEGGWRRVIGGHRVHVGADRPPEAPATQRSGLPHGAPPITVVHPAVRPAIRSPRSRSDTWPVPRRPGRSTPGCCVWRATRSSHARCAGQASLVSTMRS